VVERDPGRQHRRERVQAAARHAAQVVHQRRARDLAAGGRRRRAGHPSLRHGAQQARRLPRRGLAVALGRAEDEHRLAVGQRLARERHDVVPILAPELQVGGRARRRRPRRQPSHHLARRREQRVAHLCSRRGAHITCGAVRGAGAP